MTKIGIGFLFFCSALASGCFESPDEFEDEWLIEEEEFDELDESMTEEDYDELELDENEADFDAPWGSWWTDAASSEGVPDEGPYSPSTRSDEVHWHSAQGGSAGNANQAAGPPCPPGANNPACGGNQGGGPPCPPGANNPACGGNPPGGPACPPGANNPACGGNQLPVPPCQPGANDEPACDGDKEPDMDLSDSGLSPLDPNKPKPPPGGGGGSHTEIK